ncbi:MAG: hypothetical protein M1818_007745 [Claussenomyces sp. TS43310]|nr:MAG: hypothetical protein M1818_007745 [Claussenomyces sp. TS43310]
MAVSSTLQLPEVQALQSAEQMELLDVVDTLRAQGLGEITNLPQLIVCGDQSSGKSSVLEAISGVPFPRQDNLCTRFATKSSAAENPFLPSHNRGTEDRNRLLAFQHELTTQDDFADLFEKAEDEMGLSTADKAFSEDILKVEFCGPTQPRLTLGDLPGLIHTATGKQSPRDVELVTALVGRYLENPRSIILAIVSAKSDISNQIILTRVREVDPEGKQDFLGLARNEEVRFDLGWHVVRNLNSALVDSKPETRDEQEASYFSGSKFGSLAPDTFGIGPLRTRLSSVLFKQIRTELPRLINDIECRISINRTAQDRLGPKRNEIENLREFLVEISEKFQSICKEAVKGDYDDEFFKSEPKSERWLCSKLPGIPSPRIYGELFREYSEPWENIAREHIEAVWSATKNFLELLLEHLTDVEVSNRILHLWSYPRMEEARTKAYEKLQELLSVHKEPPLTTDISFAEKRKALQQKRIQEEL